MKRVLIEVFAPPVLGPAIILVPMIYGNGVYFREELAIFGFGFVFTLGLSVPYMMVMELAYRWGLRPSSWTSVAISTAAGLGCGAAFGLIFAVGITRWMLGLGMVVGLLTGLLVFCFHSRSTSSTAN